MRSFLITVVIAIVIAGVGAWALDLWDPINNPFPVISDDPAESAEDKKNKEKTPPKIGKPLYEKAQGYAPDNNTVLEQRTAPDTVVISGCRLDVIEKQLVSSLQDGLLLFIGKKGKATDPATEKVRINFGDTERVIAYHEWKKGDLVGKDEMVAMLDNSIALREVEKAKMQILVAQKEEQSTDATHKEAKAQFERLLNIKRFKDDAVSVEELSIKRLTMERYLYERFAKAEAIKVANVEKAKAEIMLEKHIIKNMLKGAGVIKETYKQRGYSVRALEPVLELYNIEHLRADGMVAAQYLHLLAGYKRSELKVSVEPVYEKAPFRRLPGHSAEVTSVAVSSDPNAPWIVSGSMDNTVRIWHRGFQTAIGGILRHSSPVQVVACSPKAGNHNWCLVGCEDGSLFLRDLKKLDVGKPDDAKMLAWKHTSSHRSGGVTTIAFSPTGTYFATGGADRSIIIWEIKAAAKDGKIEVTKKYAFNDDKRIGSAHEGPITALHFAPGSPKKNKDGSEQQDMRALLLVSASRDKTLRVWRLHEDGVKLAFDPIQGRGGTVSQLGVSASGRYMLFDKGRKLQLLSIDDGNMVSELANPTAATSFETLAIFSQDDYLMLTAGASEGRLQLWRRPSSETGGRGIQLQQWVTKGGSPVTCASFAPNAGMNGGSFAVSGCKSGNVYVWDVPSRKDIDGQAISNLKLDMVGSSLGSANQVRIGVNVHNPIKLDPNDPRKYKAKLTPGSTVTVVIEPPSVQR